MTELEKKIFDTFGITIDQIESAEGRQALGGFYDRVLAAVQTQDEEAIDFIITEIAALQGTPTGGGIVSEDEVKNIVDQSIAEAFNLQNIDLNDYLLYFLKVLQHYITKQYHLS
jgi:hypothetical protein